MKIYELDGQLTLLDPDSSLPKTCQASSAATTAKITELSSKKSVASQITPYQFLDLRTENGNPWGLFWEQDSVSLGNCWTLCTSPAPHKGASVGSLWQILEVNVQSKYYLTPTACMGILRRANIRGKPLIPQLRMALERQAGLIECAVPSSVLHQVSSFHINQRDEIIDLNGLSGALMTQRNMQMETFVTQPMPMAFACNQRDEVRDLLDVSAALTASGHVKQQTLLVDYSEEKNHLTPQAVELTGKQRQARIFTDPDIVPAVADAEGSGSAPTGLLYEESVSADLYYSNEETVLCLNDQGGEWMSESYDIVGTLRAQMHSHQPLVLSQPSMFENHSMDSRYNGPLEICPTLAAGIGCGGNNLPLVTENSVPQTQQAICIAGNIVDRQPQNGGNGMGYQADLAYTLTAMDHHCVAECAVLPPYQQVVGALCSGDTRGPSNQYVSQNKCIIDRPNLIRRLTPTECERLQGYPDDWTAGGSDSARYKACGNSVCIPCVNYIMEGIAVSLREIYQQDGQERGGNVQQNNEAAPIGGQAAAAYAESH